MRLDGVERLDPAATVACLDALPLVPVDALPASEDEGVGDAVRLALPLWPVGAAVVDVTVGDGAMGGISSIGGFVTTYEVVSDTMTTTGVGVGVGVRAPEEDGPDPLCCVPPLDDCVVGVCPP